MLQILLVGRAATARSPATGRLGHCLKAYRSSAGQVLQPRVCGVVVYTEGNNYCLTNTKTVRICSKILKVCFRYGIK